MMDRLWYFVSRGEPDGPSGHVVVCPAQSRAAGPTGTARRTSLRAERGGSGWPGRRRGRGWQRCPRWAYRGCESAGHCDVHTGPQRV